MATCRKIQYPMIDSTAKQNVPDPAASPSTPSVMLTALDVPTMTRTAKIDPPDLPEVDADGTSDRVKESAVEVCAQCTASTAKTSAQTSCAAELRRACSARGSAGGAP